MTRGDTVGKGNLLSGLYIEAWVVLYLLSTLIVLASARVQIHSFVVFSRDYCQSSASKMMKTWHILKNLRPPNDAIKHLKSARFSRKGGGCFAVASSLLPNAIRPSEAIIPFDMFLQVVILGGSDTIMVSTMTAMVDIAAGVLTIMPLVPLFVQNRKHCSKSFIL